MLSFAGQPVEVDPTVLLPGRNPIQLSPSLKFLQSLTIIPQGMSRKPSLLGQVPEKRGRSGIGRFAGFGFQAAALARALAVLADLGLRGSRGGKSKLTFPSFHIRKAEKGRRVLFEINFSKRAVFPWFKRSCTSLSWMSRFKIFFETLNVQVEGLDTLFSQT